MEGVSATKTRLQDAALAGCLAKELSELKFDELDRAAALLADLHNEGSLDVITCFESLNWKELSSRDQRRAAHVLEKFVAAVNDKPERMISFLDVVRNILLTTNQYYVDKGFESWIGANPTQIRRVAAFIKDSDQDSAFLEMLLKAWREIDPGEALATAIEFSYEVQPTMQRQATNAIGAFQYSTRAEAATAETRLLELALSENADTARATIRAILRTLEKQTDKSPQLVAALEKAVDRPTVEIRHELIHGLFYNSDAYPSALRKKTFQLLTTVRSDCAETLRLVDIGLYGTDIDTERELIFETLTTMLNQESGSPSLTTFDSLVTKFQTAPHEVVGWYATRWLLDGLPKICRQLASLFPPLDESAYDFKLNASNLSGAEISYLTRKIFTYLTFSHGPAVSLFSACLMSLKLKERRLLEEEIASFWLRNYPCDLELFDAVCKAYPSKGLSASIRRMRRKVEAYEGPLKALPENPALQPSTMERRVQSERAHELNKKIHRTVDENSVLASLAHKSTLLYGRSSVTYIYRSGSAAPIRQVIPLQKYHTSSKLPRMDRLHPAYLNYLLIGFRRERRPD